MTCRRLIRQSGATRGYFVRNKRTNKKRIQAQVRARKQWVGCGLLINSIQWSMQACDLQMLNNKSPDIISHYSHLCILRGSFHNWTPRDPPLTNFKSMAVYPFLWGKKLEMKKLQSCDFKWNYICCMDTTSYLVHTREINWSEMLSN